MKKWLWVLLGFSLLAVAPPALADDEVMTKLKTIAEKQDKILSELAEIKSELNIVKIRATLNG